MCQAWDYLRYHINKMHPEQAEVTEMDLALIFAVAVAEVKRWPRNQQHTQIDAHPVFRALGIDPPEEAPQVEIVYPPARTRVSKKQYSAGRAVSGDLPSVIAARRLPLAKPPAARYY